MFRRLQRVLVVGQLVLHHEAFFADEFEPVAVSTPRIPQPFGADATGRQTVVHAQTFMTHLLVCEKLTVFVAPVQDTVNLGIFEPDIPQRS